MRLRGREGREGGREGEEVKGLARHLSLPPPSPSPSQPHCRYHNKIIQEQQASPAVIFKIYSSAMFSHCIYCIFFCMIIIIVVMELVVGVIFPLPFPLSFPLPSPLLSPLPSPLPSLRHNGLYLSSSAPVRGVLKERCLNLSSSPARKKEKKILKRD